MSISPTPFHLRTHQALAKDLVARYSRHVEVVNGDASYSIVRIKRGAVALADATLPSDEFEQQMRVVMALHAPSPRRNKAEARLMECLQVIDALDDAGKHLLVSKIAERAMGCLATKARKGDGEALHRFTSLAVDLCTELCKMVRTSPKKFERIARNYARWPLMRSTHPLNSDPDSLLQDINLGAGVPVYTDRHSKWKPDAAAQVAIDLLQYVHKLWTENVEVEYADGVTEPLQSALPPFSKESADLWWTFAKDQLLSSYPKPETIAELAKLVTTPTRKQSPGRMREAILSKVRARFGAIAYQT